MRVNQRLVQTAWWLTVQCRDLQNILASMFNQLLIYALYSQLICVIISF